MWTIPEKRVGKKRFVACSHQRIAIGRRLTMLVAIHQPCFVPWLGYLDRMLRSDLFVILDHVQFERRNYQNRCMIRLEDDTKWLTVPVVQLSQKEKIIDKRVDNPEDLSGSRWWGPTGSSAGPTANEPIRLQIADCRVQR